MQIPASRDFATVCSITNLCRTERGPILCFALGSYSLMLTSLLIGLIVMVLYKPRTWCAFCPMGTVTQSICKLKNKD